MRREDDELVLWIDALCINQEGVRERGTQLMVMGKIYQYAFGVHVWFGLDLLCKDGELCSRLTESVVERRVAGFEKKLKIVSDVLETDGLGVLNSFLGDGILRRGGRYRRGIMSE